MTGRRFSLSALFGRRPKPPAGGIPLPSLARPSMSMMQKLKELIKRPFNAMKRHRNGRA